MHHFRRRRRRWQRRRPTLLPSLGSSSFLMEIELFSPISRNPTLTRPERGDRPSFGKGRGLLHRPAVVARQLRRMADASPGTSPNTPIHLTMDRSGRYTTHPDQSSATKKKKKITTKRFVRRRVPSVEEYVTLARQEIGFAGAYCLLRSIVGSTLSVTGYGQLLYCFFLFSLAFVVVVISVCFRCFKVFLLLRPGKDCPERRYS